MAELSKQLVDAMKQADERKTSAFDSIGTVRRVKDGIAYVHLAGGVDETPVQLTVDAKAGDEVQVRVSGGRAWIVGNATAPPTDNTMAKMAIDYGKIANDAAQKATKDALIANEAAQSASESAREAKETTDEINEYAETAGKTITQILNDGETAGTAAQQAKSAADSAMKGLGQVEDVVGVLEWITNHGTMESQQGETFDSTKVYFIVDPNGDYVIGGTHYSLVTDPVAADIDSYYCLSIDRSIQNYVATHIVVDSEGLWIIPDSGGNKVLIATGGAGKRYETAGTYIVGRVGNDDVTFAQFTEDEVMLGRGEWDEPRAIISSNGFVATNDAWRFESGVNGIRAETFFDQIFFEVNISGFHYKPNGMNGDGLIIYKDGGHNLGMAFCDREQMDPTGAGAFAENYSLAVGGSAADLTTSTEVRTAATGEYSFAQGRGTVASGDNSHAHGTRVEASGNNSHAQNAWTVAGYNNQTVIGQCNDNKQNNAFEIGNGTDDNNRSNAFEVDWNGNTTAGGDITAVGDVEDGQGNILADKLQEDSNGDVSITRNVSVGGDVEDGQGNVLANKADTSSLAAVATSGDYDDLSNKPTTPSDYIVEASNKGGWTYRKWKSGKVEAWYNYDGSAGTFTTWVSPIRYKDVTVSIPSGIFTASPKIFPVSRNNQFWVVHASPSSVTSFTVRLATVASSSLTPSFRVYVTSY